MSFGLARVVVVALALTHAGISAQPTDPAAAAAARPLSPGSVALMLPHANKPAVVERLTQALADPRPEVRAIAARVAFTTRNVLLAQALTDALAREQSPAAGVEVVRALALIRGAAADAAIRVALERFDSRASATWMGILCRVRAADLWRQLPELPKEIVSGQVLVEAARLQPDDAARVFARLKDTPALEHPYLAMLSSARISRGKLPPWPVLAPGLAAAGRTRIATVYLMVSTQARGEALPGEAVEAIRALSTPDNALDLAWLPVYQELARRATPNATPRSMADAIAILNPLNLPDGLAYDPVMTRLDASEVAAFQQVFGPNWKPIELPQRAAAPAPSAVAPAAASEQPSLVTRLARPMTVSLMRDLEKLLDCRLADGQVALVDVQYRPTGQVRSVSRALADSPEGCLSMASVLAALEVAPGIEPVPDARVDRLVIGMRRIDLECERQPPDRQAPSVRPGAGVMAPKKTRNVPPHYPQSLIEARIQGVVIIEATIPLSGCVADATVLRSANPGLDVAALMAVSEWRYEPARLDGIPVPVIMTVTVNFSLQ